MHVGTRSWTAFPHFVSKGKQYSADFSFPDMQICPVTVSGEGDMYLKSPLDVHYILMQAFENYYSCNY